MTRADDPTVRELLHQRRAWRDAYLKWRRAVRGFGLFLFRRVG